MNASLSDAQLNELRTHCEARIKLIQRDNQNREKNKGLLSELCKQLKFAQDEIKRREIEAKRARWNVFGVGAAQ